MWKVAALLLLCACGEQLQTNQYGNKIDRNAPVKFLIHGWTESINSLWYDGTRTAYVGQGVNVIAIDWSRHAQLIYSTAVNRLPDIGDFIAQFIIGLVKSQGIPMNKIHLVGHSLGAHLSGFTGKSIQSRAKQTLGRISGLDPAGPGYTNLSNRNRLAKSDAQRVDTILTDAGLGGLGINRSLGHVNFWPNGGKAIQPGCWYYTCSHYRAPKLFTEGITSRKFVSRRCSSYVDFKLGLCRTNPQNLLGEFTNHAVTGDFFLSTNSRPPFAQG